MSATINLKDKKFGRLLVIESAGSNKHKKVMWLCSCDCGNKTTVTTGHLRSGHTASCGCLNREINAALRHRHGLARHPLYQTWNGMKKRCYNETNDCYRWYGAKGVTICKEWLDSVKAFVEWGLTNGYKKGLTIDRLDSDGNYEPNNCQFITRSENTLKMINEHYR